MAADSMTALRARLSRNLERFERRRIEPKGRRVAAVALIIATNADGEPTFVLTRRAGALREHAGQFALPGGRAEGAETPEAVALREAAEEVGVALGPNAVLGLLDDYATRSGFVITPVVAWHGPGLTMRIQPSEVAVAYEVPARDLGAADVPLLRHIPESDAPLISVPLPSVGATIHAPTAALLYQLWEVAFEGRDTRVAHYEQPVFAWK